MLETELKELTAAVKALTAALTTKAMTVPHTEVPVVAPAPTIAVPVAPVTPAMPAPPTFAVSTAPVQQVTKAPFADAKGMLDYVMGAFAQLNMKLPGKGNEIQGVLSEIGGYQSVNDIPADKYDALYAGVQKLLGV